MTADVVVQLAQAFRRQLAQDQQVGEIALAACQIAASDLAGCWPQADEIAACCAAAPGEACAFCDSGYGHWADPQPVPAWLAEAQEIKAAAAITLEAVALAMAGPEDAIALVDVPFGQEPPHQSTGQWLANLYKTDRESFYRTFQVLQNDPGSQAAIAEARQIIFGSQPQYEHRPAIPRLSHASVRNSIPLEGHRNRLHGHGEIGAPEPPIASGPPEAEPGRPRRKRRQL